MQQDNKDTKLSGEVIIFGEMVDFAYESGSYDRAAVAKMLTVLKGLDIAENPELTSKILDDFIKENELYSGSGGCDGCSDGSCAVNLGDDYEVEEDEVSYIASFYFKASNETDAWLKLDEAAQQALTEEGTLGNIFHLSLGMK